jgi:hypothetical protein
VLVAEVAAVDRLAISVELQLVRRTVPDPHRTGSPISLPMKGSLRSSAKKPSVHDVERRLRRQPARARPGQALVRSLLRPGQASGRERRRPRRRREAALPWSGGSAAGPDPSQADPLGGETFAPIARSSFAERGDHRPSPQNSAERAAKRRSPPPSVARADAVAVPRLRLRESLRNARPAGL